jgi:hypothetical protein
MPRIANPISTEVLLARNQLRAHLSVKGNSEMALSRKSGVPQYTISKFLTGRIKSLTPDVQKFLPYVVNGIDCGSAGVTCDPRILQALCNAWDGTESGISLLASTINALAPVILQTQVKGTQPAEVGRAATYQQ